MTGRVLLICLFIVGLLIPAPAVSQEYDCLHCNEYKRDVGEGNEVWVHHVFWDTSIPIENYNEVGDGPHLYPCSTCQGNYKCGNDHEYGCNDDPQEEDLEDLVALAALGPDSEGVAELNSPRLVVHAREIVMLSCDLSSVIGRIPFQAGSPEVQ